MRKLAVAGSKWCVAIWSQSHTTLIQRAELPIYLHRMVQY